MNPVARLLAFVAPYNCLGCNREGRLICGSCRDSLPAPSKCTSPINITAMTLYANPIARALLWRLKSDRAIDAAKEIAEMLPPLFSDAASPTAITHLPTAPSRIRMRGYDQAQQIAKHLARRLDVPYQSLLIRQTNVSQVGSDRVTRQIQATHAFAARRPNLHGMNILLIDDVMTTGASLAAAASVLYAAGATQVNAAVFARA